MNNQFTIHSRKKKLYFVYYAREAKMLKIVKI